MAVNEFDTDSSKGLGALRAKNGSLWNWFIFSYYVAYFMQNTKQRLKGDGSQIWKISEVKSLPCYRVASGQGKVREIRFFFKVREKSGNFVNW